MESLLPPTASASAAAMASASASAVAPLKSEIPPVSLTMGALLVGWGLSSIIFGVLCLQTWIYFLRYPNDQLWIRMLVASVLALEVGHQACIGHACWRYLITDYGVLEAVFFEDTIWSLSSVVLLGALVGAIVKIFLGWRAYKIGRGNALWPAMVIWIMAVTQLGLATTYAAKATHIFIGELTEIKALGCASLSFGAATDIITAIVLCTHLRTMRTGFKRTGGIVNRLFIMSVQTGVITSVFSLAVLILYQLMPKNFVFIAVYFLVCKLYSNSCLATLNTRAYVKNGDSTDDSYDVSNSSPSHALAIMQPARSRGNTLDIFSGGKDRQASSSNPSNGGRYLNRIYQSNIQIGIHHEVSVIQDGDVSKVAIDTAT